MSPEIEQPTAGCDRQRVGDFLKSDHYHLEDPELIAHLDKCAACRAYLEAQAGEAEQWMQATQLLQPSDFDQAGSADFSAATCGDALVSHPAAVKEVLDSLVPSEEPDHLGRLGNYEVTGVVGVGGMGVVLKAIDPSLDRIVAVKVMSPRLANSENARKRFAREAKAAAAVLHPNVIPIHSVSSGASLPYLVMSYVRGGSLQKRLEREGPLLLVELLRIGSQIAAGLEAAHEQGLVHRDIKPENILLEEGVERVTITDFGLARSVDDNTITQLGSIAGTPQYMSPEQARGEQLDQQSDLFSLGSVLYSMCTGRPPFRDESSYGVMRKIIDEAAPPITEFNSKIPAWMVTIVEKLMSKRKEERFVTAAEVHKVLEACLSHVQQPSANPIPSNLKKHQPASARNTSMKAFIGSGVILMAVLAAFVGQHIHSLKVRQAEKEVRGPLSEFDSVIRSMMNSSNDLVFLNLGAIGKDENYLVFEPIDGGVTMRFPAFGTDSWSKRQGKQVERLKEVANALALPLSESSELSDDGSVKGVNFVFRVTGDPEVVAGTIKRVITETFQVDSSEECTYQYANMPGGFSRRNGEQPRQVSGREFVREFQRGKHVYLGEQEHLVFMIPQALASEDQLYWDSKIWCTDVRQLQPDDLDQVRNSE